MRKMSKPSAFLLFMALALSACGEKSKTSSIEKKTEPASDRLIGSWVAPVNGMPDMEEGMKLEKGGAASSINMATLVYESWKTTEKNESAAENHLILKGKSIGNGVTGDFTDTLKIDKLTADTLIISKGNYTRTYRKQQ